MKTKLITAIFLFTIFSVKAQDIQQYLNNLQEYNTRHLQEKVYIQTDKPVYAAGENIYFKTYTTIGVHNLFSSLSAVLYAELISPSNQIVERATISTAMGVGIGDFTLSDTITEGVYRLRAYTNWMKNAGDSYFFDKKIPIFNGRSDNVITNTTYEDRENDILYKININSISGLPIAKSRVSFRIMDGDKQVERKTVTSSEEGVISIPVNKKYERPILHLRFQNIDKAVVNKIIKPISPRSSAITEIFPEGGKLIVGRINNIAAKSLNSQGLGIKSTLFIKQGKDTIGTLHTNELGMGAVTVFIDEAIPLEIIAKYDDGTQNKVPSPEIHPNGFSILVNNRHASKLYAQLNTSADQLDGTDVYFIVHHMGEVFYVSKSKLNKEEIVFSVDKEKLPTGVLTISILNNQFLPVMERAVFHYKEGDILKHNISLNKNIYSTREKVEVKIEVGDSSDSLRYGAFSASVVDLSRVNLTHTNEAHILASLLIKNDVKGNIENPNYYFNDDSSIKQEDLDFLMLTQGWRKIDWVKIGSSEKQLYEPEKHLKISGYTKKLGRSKPEPNANVQLISTKNFLDYIDTTSNEDGYFEFDNLVFPDSIKFIITAKDAIKGKNNIDIIVEEDKGFPVGDDEKMAEASWDVNQKYLKSLMASKEFFAELERLGVKEKAIAIEEVLVTARKQNKAPEYSSNLNGPGRADQVITAEDLEICTTLEMCLAGRLTGVYFQDGTPYSTRGNVPMQVVLDGMYIEPENISMINIHDVESIEVLRSISYTAIYGMHGANGLIVITSKRGTSAMSNYTPKGILTVQPQGFLVTKAFYKPAYDLEDGPKYNSDVRSTIHWEPAIVTDKEGKAAFDFFTSDGKGKYQLIIEGLDLQGRILRKETEIAVE